MSGLDCDFVADIGGTHARFARVGRDGTLGEAVTLRLREHAGLVEAVEHWLAGRPGPRPIRGALAVATPVDGDAVALTNAGWRFSLEAARRALGLSQLIALNDFTALAWSLPGLQAHERRQVGGGVARDGRPIALIGPGTGLGVSGLVPASGRWVPLAGEGGHASFAPADAREAALLAQAWRTHPHVSFERLVSGIGLPLLLEAVAAVDGLPRPEPWQGAAPTPAMILEAALVAGDPLCRRVMTDFCAMLGTAAGNLALTLGAGGGVYVGGGLPPRLGRFFDDSPFRARFEAKGRFAGWLATVPTWVIVAEHPALAGAARALAAAG